MTDDVTWSQRCWGSTLGYPSDSLASCTIYINGYKLSFETNPLQSTLRTSLILDIFVLFSLTVIGWLAVMSLDDVYILFTLRFCEIKCILGFLESDAAEPSCKFISLLPHSSLGTSLIDSFGTFIADKISKRHISHQLFHLTYPPLPLNLQIFLLSDLHLNLKYLKIFSTVLTSTLIRPGFRRYALLSNSLDLPSPTSSSICLSPQGPYYSQWICYLSTFLWTYSRQRPTLKLPANL